MKIAFILAYGSLYAPSNGIIGQAMTWKNGLEQLGHEIDLINMWHTNDWAGYNAIVYFGFGHYMADHIREIYPINNRIYVAPILDPTYSIRRLWIYARWGIQSLKLTSHYHELYLVKNMVCGFLVRSNHEKEYIAQGYSVPETKCHIVPLSFKLKSVIKDEAIEKENFCLHVSLLTDERKNVKRLIEAAKKYKFKLILGGKLRNQEERDLLNSWIDSSPYVEYKGFLSDEELMNLYQRAKVFALPSIKEGVGVVALEAAALGCDIVLTSIGGPREYYNGMAKLVDPYSIDQIGSAVKAFLDGDSSQPKLSQYIKSEYNIESITRKLESVFIHP